MELAREIRLFILQRYSGELSAMGLTPSTVPDHFDILAEGVIDSIGLLDIINAIEERFATQIDLENVPPEDLTVIGPLTNYIAACMATKSGRSPENL